MPVDDSLADGEADARAGNVGVPVKPLEHPKYPFGIPLIESDSVVPDRECPLVALAPGAQLDARARFRPEFQGVADDVLEELPQLRGVSHDPREIGVDDLGLAFADRHFEIGQRLPKDGHGVGRGQFRPLGADPRIGQQVVDQPLHPVCAVHREVDVLVGALVELSIVAASQEGDVARYHAERFLEVVGGDVGELLQFPVRAGEFFGLRGDLCVKLGVGNSARDVDADALGEQPVAVGVGGFGERVEVKTPYRLAAIQERGRQERPQPHAIRADQPDVASRRLRLACRLEDDAPQGLDDRLGERALDRVRLIRSAVGHLHGARLVGVNHVIRTVGDQVDDDPVKGYELRDLPAEPLVDLLYGQG